VEGFKEPMQWVSLALELTGVIAIVLGFGYAVLRGIQLSMSGERVAAYSMVRRVFGKSILLGLEILVAADLIRTIAVEPTLDNLYVLGLLVLIRTFLSWSLDVELEGVWPWRRRQVENEERCEGIERSSSESGIL